MPVAVAHSSTAEGTAALGLGVRECAVRSTSLVVVHAVQDAEVARDPAQTDRYRAEVSAQLEALGAPAELQWRVAVVGAGGSVAEALVDLAVHAEAEVLVIGTRRRSAVGKFLLGSTVQRVVLDAPMPVLVTKGG